jgi:hypothetical protein
MAGERTRTDKREKRIEDILEDESTKAGREVCGLEESVYMAGERTRTDDET